MQVNKIEFRKIRDFGELLNITFEFIRENFKKLFLSLIFIAGPGIILAGIAGAFYGSSFFNIGNTFDLLFFSGAVYFIALFISIHLIITVTYSFIELYLETELTGFDINDVWERVKKNFFALLLTSIGSIILIALASLLIIIPGIYLSIVLSIIYIVRLREKLGFFESVSRCRQLVSGNWWFTFALMLILVVIQVFIGFIFSIPEYIRLFIGFLHMQNETPAFGAIMIITQIISSFGYIFNSILVIGLAFHYYSLVEKKEAVGLLEKLNSINAQS
jgi:hypothetical protein